jgi:hypothetical protein
VLFLWHLSLYLFLKSSFPVEFFYYQGHFPFQQVLMSLFFSIFLFFCAFLFLRSLFLPFFVSFAALIHCFVIIVAAANIKMFIFVVSYSFSSKHSVPFISSFSYISYCFSSGLLMFPFQALLETSPYTSFEGVPLAYSYLCSRNSVSECLLPVLPKPVWLLFSFLVPCISQDHFVTIHSFCMIFCIIWVLIVIVTVIVVWKLCKITAYKVVSALTFHSWWGSKTD